MAEAGLVTIDGGRLTISEPGRTFARLIAAGFDAYFPANRSRHSVAV
jgi:oxygen-independent coproporphyrinogen-3 oxidase